MKIDQQTIVNELKELLKKKLKVDVLEVVLYGSQLKGTATENSDFDVVIILKDNYDWKTKREINDLCYELDLKYDIFLDALIISEQELKNSIRGKHPLFSDALKNGYRI